MLVVVDHVLVQYRGIAGFWLGASFVAVTRVFDSFLKLCTSMMRKEDKDEDKSSKESN